MTAGQNINTSINKNLTIDLNNIKQCKKLSKISE